MIIAFFPCIYFEEMQMNYYRFYTNNNAHKPKHERVVDAIERLQKRTMFHTLLYKLVWISEKREIPLIIENPATAPNYLITGLNFPRPTIIDNNRMEKGDFFKKPTAYWFFNCEATNGFSWQNDKEQKLIKDSKQGKQAGLCSEERSMISSDYARNWILSYILGKDDYSHLPLFAGVEK